MNARLAHYCERLLPLHVHPIPVDVPPLVETTVWHRLRDTDRASPGSAN